MRTITVNKLVLLEEIIKFLKKYKKDEVELNCEDENLLLPIKIKEENKKVEILSKDDQELLSLFENPPNLGEIKGSLKRKDLYKEWIEEKYDRLDRH